MPQQPADWPTMIDATRLEYRVAKDRSHFLLTVHSATHPSIDIRLPLSFAPTLLAQLENMIAGAGVTIPKDLQ